MTNPNSITEIQLNHECLRSSKIKSICLYQSKFHDDIQNLWIGTDDGIIAVGNKPMEGRNEFKPFYLIKNSPNNTVKKIYPFLSQDSVLVHLIDKTNSDGVVKIIHSGGIVIDVVDGVRQVVCYDGLNSGYFAVVKGLNIIVYKFAQKICDVLFSIKTQGRIQALDINEFSILYFINECYEMIHFDDINKVEKISKSIVQNPFVFSISKDRFLIGFKEFMIITENKTESEVLFNYDKEYGSVNFALGYNDKFYCFYDNLFTLKSFKQNDDKIIFNIPNVSDASIISNDLVILSNKIRIVGNIPKPKDMEPLISSVKDIDIINDILKNIDKVTYSQIIYDLTVCLCNANKKHEALALVSKFLVNDIISIIQFYPILICHINSKNVIGQPLDKNDLSFVDDYINFLTFTRKEYMMDDNLSNSHDLIIINTVLAECYSIKPKCRELDELIKENKLDMKILNEFIIDSQKTRIFNAAPAFAIYKTNTGDPEVAFSIWKKLDDAMSAQKKFNPLFVTEASYTVKMYKDGTKLNESLDWILKRDKNSPKLAINALLSVNHDITSVFAWLKNNNLEKYQICYYIFISRQKENTQLGVTLANEAFIYLIKILSEIDAPSFEMEKLIFIDNYNSIGKEEIIKEVKNIALEILQIHSDSINSAEIIKTFSKSLDEEILFPLYQYSKQYELAIDIICKDSFCVEKIQEFCRSAPEPDIAFSIALRKIKPEEIVMKYTKFIEDNLLYMNLFDLISLIPEDTKIRKLKFVEKSYKLLFNRLNNLDNQISSTESLIRKSNFEKSKAQSKCYTLNRDITCKTCGKLIVDDQICLVSSDNNLYHPHCKP